MLAGEYFEFDIPAMYILIGVACYSSGSDTWKYKDIPLDMAKGEEVYLLIEVNTRKNECADMRIISKTEFLERAQESKEIRVGDVS